MMKSTSLPLPLSVEKTPAFMARGHHLKALRVSDQKSAAGLAQPGGLAAVAGHLQASK
jgi:hypothetical protein